MGWKGAIRSVGAAVRRAEREARRQQRELDRREKERAKQLEQHVAAGEVADYDEFVSRLISIHVEIGEPIDWKDLRDQAEPHRPQVSRFHESEALGQLESYRPSFIDKIFRKQEERLAGLEADLATAKARDSLEFEDAVRRYEEDLMNWRENRELAGQVLDCSPEACMAVIEELAPFSEISELGSKLNFTANPNPAIISVELDVHGKDIVPAEKKYLLKSGKLSVKPLPKGEFYSLYQDYVCSCCLRIAGEIFGLLPMAAVIVTAMDQVLNTRTGHLERLPILSVVIPRSTFERLNLRSLDPSDSMENFLFKMKFLKTKGFKPVAAIEFEDLPEDVKVLGPQKASIERLETQVATGEPVDRAIKSASAPAWKVEAKNLLASGKKILAVKLVRETTAMSLKDAKDLVESWE